MNTTPLQILCIDDNTSTGSLCRKACDALGYSVQIVRTGIEAQKILTDSNFSIVISDFLMPELDGIELLAWMRNRNINTYFILITPYYNNSFDSLLTKYRFCEFHRKQFSLPMFTEILRLVVRKIFNKNENTISEMFSSLEKMTSPSSGNGMKGADAESVCSWKDIGGVLESPPKDIQPRIEHLKDESVRQAPPIDSFASELLSVVKLEIAGFDTAIVFDNTTKTISGWVSDNKNVTSDNVQSLSANVFQYFNSMNTSEKLHEENSSSLTILSGDYFQYITTLFPNVFLYLIVNHGGKNIGMVKLALSKVLSQISAGKKE